MKRKVQKGIKKNFDMKGLSDEAFSWKHHQDKYRKNLDKFKRPEMR